jgi:putative protease
MGLKRIILSRELSLEEIKEIRQHVPEMELETFIHGAICIAYSGRCLLSNYFTHRDANQGTCTNACRWQYNVYSEPEVHISEQDIYKPIKGAYYIEESERPGELMPIDEDEHGTYIMNAKDLSTIQIIDDLISAGISSLKIEGRTKSHYYVSMITRAYRQAIDRSLHNDEITPDIVNEVYTVANRGYVTGFLERNPQQNGQNYEESHSKQLNRQFAGLVDSWNETTRQVKIRVRNRFEPGDQMELVTPRETIPFKLETILDKQGTTLPAAHGGGQDVWLPLPKAPEPFSILRKIL